MAKPSTRPGRARPARRAAALIGVVLSLAALNSVSTWAQAPVTRPQAAATAPVVPAIPVDGKLTYRGITVDATEIRDAAQYKAIMTSLVHQIDIMADWTFFGRAQGSEAYPKDAYVLKNVQEFFAVTASLYLWGNVDRPPHTRDKLKAAQPVYYAWLGQLFGVAK